MTHDQYMTLATGLITPTPKLRRVTVRRGSWKWQDAWKIVCYHVRRTRDGWPIYYSHHDVTKKSSEPQLRRVGWDVPIGSLHNIRV